MASKTMTTNVNGLSVICEYSTSISGTYPSAKFVFSYAFKIKQAYTNSFYEGDTTFTFGSKTHTLYVSRVSGIGTSGVLASGTLSLDFGTYRTASKTITASMNSNFPNGATCSTSITASQTIPEPKIEAAIIGVTYDSVTFDIDLKSNPNGFYKVVVSDTSGKVYELNDSVVTGLSEETTYVLYVEARCMNEKETYAKRVELTIVTLVDQSKLYMHSNGEWVTGKVFMKVNGEWKKAKGVFIKQNGNWLKGA